MDLNKAIYWIKKAADQDHEDGLLSMVGFYMNGYGVDKDVELAYRYFYKYHKKIGSKQYKSWIEAGLDVEDFIDNACWHSDMQNLIKNRFNSIGMDSTNSDMM